MRYFKFDNCFIDKYSVELVKISIVEGVSYVTVRTKSGYSSVERFPAFNQAENRLWRIMAAIDTVQVNYRGSGPYSANDGEEEI